MRRFTKKLTTVVLAAIMVLTLFPVIVTAQTDPSSWAVEAVIETKILGLARHQLYASTQPVDNTRAIIRSYPKRCIIASQRQRTILKLWTL